MQESDLVLHGDCFDAPYGFQLCQCCCCLCRICEDFWSLPLITGHGPKTFELVDSLQFLGMNSNVCCDGAVTVHYQLVNIT